MEKVRRKNRRMIDVKKNNDCAKVKVRRRKERRKIRSEEKKI